ncbi:MAG: DUF1848 domain-containing protein [Bacillota bacterium]
MILSVSRRTDIPAFHWQWFKNAIAQGRLEVVNPYNPRQRRPVVLSPDSVDAIVFWSKAPQAPLEDFRWLKRLGYRFCFHFTINGYPEALEPNLPALADRIHYLFELAELLPTGAVIWRYDPVCITSITPPQFHVDQFGNLGLKLRDCVTRVVVSKVDLYPKVVKRLKHLASRGITMPSPDQLELQTHTVMQALGNIARELGLEIQSCCEPDSPHDWHIPRGKCIDEELINSLFGLNLHYRRHYGQRQDCMCTHSLDVGSYSMCFHGCVYCYANPSRPM